VRCDEESAPLRASHALDVPCLVGLLRFKRIDGGLSLFPGQSDLVLNPLDHRRVVDGTSSQICISIVAADDLFQPRVLLHRLDEILSEVCLALFLSFHVALHRFDFDLEIIDLPLQLPAL
jgi:hypothetical protein